MTFMGVVLELPGGGVRAHCKGASEIVLAACDKVINENGEVLALFRSTGITLRMVTRDNITTAKSIAKECGILTDDGIAINGVDFHEKSLEVMARSSPLDKHLCTTFCEVVAVIGDGTNDSLSLHEAIICLSLGIGTLLEL
ncbi:calcium-transporting ATPase 2, plasma membrane-type protein, partial [Tanacetum coccineum]